MKLTNSQIKVLEKIKVEYPNVEITSSDICLIVKFSVYDDQIYNRERYMVKIGKCGSLEFLNVDRVLSDIKNRKILAKLCGYKLGKSHITFSKYFG